MSQSYVQVPVDGAGKKIDAWVTAVANQYRQTVVIGDPDTDGNYVAISSRLRLPVELEQLFDFDSGAGSSVGSGIGIMIPASGGPTIAGIVTNPFFVRLSDGTNPLTAFTVSGAVTANAGTDLNTSALALEAGGNLAGILAKLDVALSTRASQTTLASILSALDVALSTRASQATLATLLLETTFTGRIGEVQASPTANTVLDRLKALLTGIVLAAGTNAIGKLAANSGVDIGDVDVTSIVPISKPTILTLEAEYTSAQTNTAIITESGGGVIHVTQVQVTADEANTVGVGFRIGFGASTTPTTTSVLASHPGLVPGSGLSRGDGSADLGFGAANDDVRITSEVPTGGAIRVVISYYVV